MPEPRNKWLALAAWADGEHDAPSVAFVELTQGLVDSLAARASTIEFLLKARDPRFYKAVYWDGSAYWVGAPPWGAGSDDVVEGVLEAMDELGGRLLSASEPYLVLDALPTWVDPQGRGYPSAAAIVWRTETDLMEIDQVGAGPADVQWVATPEHLEYRIFTTSVPVDCILQGASTVAPQADR